MDRATLLSELQEVERVHSPWHSHNVVLPHGLFTIGAEAYRRQLSVIEDRPLGREYSTREPLGDLRVLDLGCGEGLYALGFAQHGAETIGIEARDSHLVWAEFARRALRLNNASSSKVTCAR